MVVAAHAVPGAMEKWIKSTMPSVSKLAARVEAFVVESEKDYTVMAGCLREAKQQVAFIEAERVKITKPINEGLRSANALFKRPAEVAKETVAAADGKMRDYRRGEQERAAAEQRRLDEEAAEEQAKLQRRADAKADRAEAKGDPEKAQAIRDAVPEVVAATAEGPKIPDIAGQYTKAVWKFEVTDLPALMKAVLAGKAPAEAVLANEVFIGKEARDKKDELKWPGVRVYPEDVTVSTGNKYFSDGEHRGL